LTETQYTDLEIKIKIELAIDVCINAMIKEIEWEHRVPDFHK